MVKKLGTKKVANISRKEGFLIPFKMENPLEIFDVKVKKTRKR